MLHSYLYYFFVVKSTKLKYFFQVCRREVYWLLLLPGFIMTSFMFLCVLALVGTILMMKGVSKVSVENWLNNIGRTCCCCCHVNVRFLRGFKELLRYYLKANGELVTLCIAFKYLFNPFQKKLCGVVGVLDLEVTQCIYPWDFLACLII